MVAKDRRKYIRSMPGQGRRKNSQNKWFHTESAFMILKKKKSDRIDGEGQVCAS